MVENWIECYHHLGTHRDSVEVVQPARTTQVVPSHGAPWACMTVDSLDGIEGEPGEWMPGITARFSASSPCGRRFHSSSEAACHATRSGCMSCQWTATSHHVTWNLLAHPEQLDDSRPTGWPYLMAMLVAVHAEDMAACARVQAGLRSGLIDHLRLTPL